MTFFRKNGKITNFDKFGKVLKKIQSILYYYKKFILAGSKAPKGVLTLCLLKRSFQNSIVLVWQSLYNWIRNRTGLLITIDKPIFFLRHIHQHIYTTPLNTINMITKSSTAPDRATN